MATTSMLRSLVEIDYMQDPIKTEEGHQKLNSAIEEICEQLLQEIFGNQETIDQTEWNQKTENYTLFHSIEKIRNVIFLRAKVERAYINEEENQKHIERLDQKQRLIKNKAEEEERKRQ